jgi:outer membrane lipoprotein-sorting protein
MVKKILLQLGLIVVILFLILPALSVSSHAADFSADMINQSPMGNIKGKMFFKKGNFRQEMMMGGQKQITIFRKDKGVVWVLMPAQMMYMEMQAGGRQDMAPVDPDEIDKLGEKKYLGKEKVNGYMCSKYRYTLHDKSSGTAIYWISDKLKFPIKMKMDGTSGDMTMEYRNIREKTVPASLFSIPDGYQKMSMPMMPGMPGQ